MHNYYESDNDVSSMEYKLRHDLKIEYFIQLYVKTFVYSLFLFLAFYILPGQVINRFFNFGIQKTWRAFVIAIKIVFCYFGYVLLILKFKKLIPNIDWWLTSLSVELYKYISKKPKAEGVLRAYKDMIRNYRNELSKMSVNCSYVWISSLYVVIYAILVLIFKM